MFFNIFSFSAQIEKMLEGRQDYISLANPHRPVSTSLGFEPKHIKWGKGERRTARMRKSTVYPPTSYFGIGGAQKVIPKNLQSPSPLPHNSDSILNPLMLEGEHKGI